MLMSTNTIQMLMRYKAWANKLIFEAIDQLPPEEITKERKNLFPNIIRVLNHTYIVDLIWQAHLEGKAHGLTERNPKEHPPLTELWTLQQEIDTWYIVYSDKLSHDTLNEEVNFKSISGNKGSMTRNEILLHIANHATYHRGFIADMFYQIPAKPPTTDLPVFFQNQSPFLLNNS